MALQRFERLQQRAYELWEAAGRPDENAETYWYQAERELSGESDGLSSDRAGADTQAAGAGDEASTQGFGEEASAASFVSDVTPPAPENNGARSPRPRKSRNAK